MTTTVLTLSRLSAGYGARTVLEDVSLSVEDRALTVLAGAVGVGKSLLLSVLSGTARGWTEWRTAELGGAPLGGGHWVPVLGQMALRLPAAQRIEAIGDFLNSRGDLFCLDEPTAGLNDVEEQAVMAVVAEAAWTRAILIVTHDLRSVEDAASSVAVLSSGRITEQTPGPAFFAGPVSEAGRSLLATGSSGAPSASAPVHTLAPEYRPFPATIPMAPRARSAGSVDWIIEGQLGIADRRAGMPYPARLPEIGVVIDLDDTHGTPGSGTERAVMPWSARRADAAARLDAICAACRAAMARGRSVVLRSGWDDAAAMVVAATVLVAEGASACDAVEAVAHRTRGPQMTLKEEQAVWDFELRYDLRREDERRAAQEA